MSFEDKTTFQPDNPRAAAFRSIMFFVAVYFFFFIPWSFQPLEYFYFGNVADNLKYMMNFGEQASWGLLPYRDVPVEYPPLGALWLWALSPFSGNFNLYRPVFCGLMTLWAFGGLLALWKIAGGSKERRFKVTLFYTAAVIAAGPIGVVSFDYIPAALTIWALAYHSSGRGTAAAILLSLATAAKIYPAVLFPVFIFFSYKKNGHGRALHEGLIFIILSAALLCSPLLVSTGGYIEAFKYHSGRGIEAGSIYGAALLILQFAGLKVTPLFQNGSWNFETPGSGLADAMSMSSSCFMLVLIFISYTLSIRKYSSYSAIHDDSAGNPSTGWLFNSSMAALLAFIIGFKVGSPQFLCWIVPTVAAIAAEGSKKSKEIFFVFFTSGILAQAVFPWSWEFLIFGNPGAAVLLIMLKILLIMIFARLLQNNQEI